MLYVYGTVNFWQTDSDSRNDSDLLSQFDSIVVRPLVTNNVALDSQTPH